MLLCYSALTVISRRPPKNLLVNKFNKLLKWSPHFCEITTQINGASSPESRVQTQRPTCKPILGLRRLLKSLFVENLQPKPCLVKTKFSLLSTHIGISARPLTTDRPYKDCWSDDHWGRINPPFSRSCWFLCESFRDWCWGDLVSVAETGGGVMEPWNSQNISIILNSNLLWAEGQHNKHPQQVMGTPCQLLTPDPVNNHAAPRTSWRVSCLVKKVGPASPRNPTERCLSSQWYCTRAGNEPSWILKIHNYREGLLLVKNPQYETTCFNSRPIQPG